MDFSTAGETCTAAQDSYCENIDVRSQGAMLMMRGYFVCARKAINSVFFPHLVHNEIEVVMLNTVNTGVLKHLPAAFI